MLTRPARALALGLAAAWPLGALAATPPAAPAGAARVVLAVDRGDPYALAVGQAIEKRLGGSVPMSRFEFAAEDLADPIRKGKALAAIGRARLVVAVGDSALEFVARESEDVPFYFAGAGEARGADLASAQSAGGLLAYSPKAVLGALPSGWKGGIAVLYTPGYEPVLERIKATAAEEGAKLTARKVPHLRNLGEAATELFSSSRVVWVLGDPLLSRGAGFEYLTESALARGVPLIGAGPRQVRQGALYCARTESEAEAQSASAAILDWMKSPRALGVGFSTGPSSVFYQPALAAKFGLDVQRPRWQPAQ